MPRIGEMRVAAAASVGLFPRIEVDPAHAVDLCDLAAEALKTRDLLIRIREGLRRSAANEKQTIDHLRGFMLGMADAVSDSIADGDAQ